jgi:hypothetical protein
MYLSKQWIKMNKVSFAIILFLMVFSIFHYMKPAFAYNTSGGFRPFGVGYKHKTVIPIWIIAIILAIFSYLAVLAI